MMANIEESTRGGRILLYQLFRYMKNLEKNDTIYWSCCVAKCHAPIRTNVFKNSDTIRVYGEENTIIQAIAQTYMTIIDIVTMMSMMTYLARI